MFRYSIFNPEDKLSERRKEQQEFQELQDKEQKQKELIKKWKQIFKY